MNIDDASKDSAAVPYADAPRGDASHDDASHGDGGSKRPNLSDLGGDVAHKFDQTNGIVEGLEGNAEATDDTDGTDGTDGTDDGDLLVHPTLDEKSANKEGRA